MKLRKKPDTKSTRHFPLIFWPKCDKCQKRFGFERGCKILINSFTRYRYLCGNCSNHGDKIYSDKVFKEIDENLRAKMIANRPKWPPFPQRGGSKFRVKEVDNTNDDYITIL
jgi:hypothetical protein